jgi:hypothetical protein
MSYSTNRLMANSVCPLLAACWLFCILALFLFPTSNRDEGIPKIWSHQVECECRWEEDSQADSDGADFEDAASDEFEDAVSDLR